MPRRNFNDGQELIFQDMNGMSSSLEMELYDRLIYELMRRQQNTMFGNSFFVSYVNSTTVQVALGNGVQYDSSQVDPEPKTRLLYLSANQNKTITTPDTSNPRIDIVCIRANRATAATESRQYKDPSSGNVTSVSQIVETDWLSDLSVVAGTPAGSPVAPATPSGYIKIAELTVAANTGIASQSSIADKRTRFRFGDKITTISTNYTVDLDDQTIMMTGTITATLPPSANCYDATTGLAKKFTFVNTGNAGTPSIQGNGSELISDNNIQQIPNQYTSITVTTNGTQWYML